MALLLVLVAELLAVRLLLAPAPGVHVVRPDDNEQQQGRAAGHQDNTNPSNDLEHVVGARHQAKTVAVRDLAGRLPGLAQVREVPMHVEVGQLADGVEGHAHVGDEVVGGGAARQGGGGEGGVDLEGAEEAGDGPVEQRVAEDEGEGHGVGGELVQEQGLELALDEVRADHGEGGLLREGQRRGAVVGDGHEVLDQRVHGWVQLVPHAEEEGVEEEGAQVLDEVDEAPADLGAC